MNLDVNHFYRAMAPRLTVLVSTADSQGNHNAAPFSFCSPISTDPPLLMISSAFKRHTLANIRETGEFVVNIPGELLVAAVQKCGDPLPKGESEIFAAGLAPGTSEFVGAPYIQDAVAYFECRLEWEKDAGDHAVVVGRVLKAVVKDEFWNDDSFDFQDALPVLHVGGRTFTVGDRMIIA
jgi:flavin reductase (DIM6/NTAB) family NADH-FMN oxidoreductase RutF